MTLQSFVQSKGDVAKFYKGRYEDITQGMVGAAEIDPDGIVKALKNRLDREADHSLHQVSLRHKEGERLRDLNTEMRVQEHEVKKA